MLGSTIEAKSPFSILIIIFGLLILIFAGLGLAFDSPAWWLAILPMALPIPFLLIFRPKAMVIQMNENGMQLEHPHREIPWHTIHGVRRRNQKQHPNRICSARYELEVHHDEGILRIPHTANPPVDKLFSGFMAVLSPSGSNDLPPVLHDNIQKWTTTFGEDKVFTFKARPRLGNGSNGALIAVALAMTVGMVLALILGLNLPLFAKARDIGAHLGTLSFFVFFSAIIFLMVGISRQNAGPHRNFKNWKKSGVIVSPLGMAMSQGVLQGEMKWAEVLEVQFQKKLRDGIKIRVAGAEFQIFDIYDRPLFIIYRHIMKYWSNEDV